MTIKLYNPIIALKILFRQLYLSVTSADFYYAVHSHYRGYGIKYIFTLSFLSSMIYVFISFDYISNLRDYFIDNKIDSRTRPIEYVINQLPIISYDGENISIDAAEPFFLYDEHQNKIATIDTAGSLETKERIKIPIIFNKNKISLSLTNNNNFSVSYQTLFFDQAKIITHKVIKDNLGRILTYAQTMFIYAAMPLFIIIHFAGNLIENFFIIILIYFISILLGINTNFKSSIRIAMFSSGILVLLQPITILIPQVSNYLWISLLWTNSLVFIALSKIREGAVKGN